jgi:hypothetical protein
MTEAYSFDAFIDLLLETAEYDYPDESLQELQLPKLEIATMCARVLDALGGSELSLVRYRHFRGRRDVHGHRRNLGRLRPANQRTAVHWLPRGPHGQTAATRRFQRRASQHPRPPQIRAPA